MSLASSWWTPEIQLNSLRCIGHPLQQQIIWPKMSVLYRLRIPGLEKSQKKDSCSFKVLLICYDVASHTKYSFPYLTWNSFSQKKALEIP